MKEVQLLAPPTASAFDLLKYVGSVAAAAVVEIKMDDLGWRWVREGAYLSNYAGPMFAFKGSNDRMRCNIRPWKKADGTFVWRCHHPAFKDRDTFVEFLDPVSCAVAQEVQGG